MLNATVMQVCRKFRGLSALDSSTTTGVTATTGMSCASGTQRKAQRVSRRARRGLTILDATLALVIGTVALSQIAQLATTRVEVRSVIQDSRLLTSMAKAGREYVLSQPQSPPESPPFTVGTPVTMTPAALSALGFLGAGLTDQSATGREFSIMWFPRGENGIVNEIVVMARAATRTGEAIRYDWPQSAEGVGLVGLVHSFSPEFIRGLGLNYGIEWLDDDYAAEKPQLGDLIALDIVRQDQSVTPYLHRNVILGSPELNMMDASLDMNGNDILDVADLDAESVGVSGVLETTALQGTTTFVGDVNTGALTVTGDVLMQSDVIVGGTVTAVSAKISSDVTAQSIETASATVTEALTVRDAAVTGLLTVDNLGVQNLTGRTVTVDNLRARSVTTDTIIARQLISTDHGDFNTIYTNGCTGC